MLLLSLLPLLLFIIFIFVAKFRLILASLISLVAVLFLTFFVWEIKVVFLSASFLKGLFVATDILIIIFGALFFLEVMKNSGVISSLSVYFKKISPDYRIQVILLAWFLENFLEGTAGFGTPSTVVAPLLVAIGLSPLLAVSVALLGNSASVVFGAAGTPIQVGFAGLNTLRIPFYSGLVNIVGFLVPIFMLWLITSKRENSRKQFLDAIPFAILSGFAFVIPSFFLTYFGQEFPSIIGSVIGLLIVLLFIKLKIFIPKDIILIKKEKLEEKKLSFPRTIFPYVFLIAFLIIEKFIFNNFIFNINFGINHAFNFFNPGVALILAAIPSLLVLNTNKKTICAILKSSLTRAIEPFFVIAIISVMVQLMINSGQNLSGKLSMLGIIANNFNSTMLPVFAPIIGAFGSFLTGSATVSNIMFGGILSDSASVLGVDSAIILSLQLVGAAAGNMIALADILPAQAVVGLEGQERKVIKNVITPCLIYVILVAIVGLLLLRFTFL
jgi:lactate permease